MRFDIVKGGFLDVATDGSRLAVVGSDCALDWEAFRRAVGRWVAEAAGAGIGPDIPVVIYGHKESEFVVAMAGCLELRAPFVPVDEIYPEDRLFRIAEIIKAPAIYRTAQRRFHKLGHPPHPMAEADLAYVMFTSGSTGEPKGVQIGRAGVVGLVAWMRDCFKLGARPVFMNQAPFSFDLSMYEVFGFLGLGGTLLLNSRAQVAEAQAFQSRLQNYGVTVWVSTPSFAHQQLLDKRFDGAHLPQLATFLFCGETLPSKLALRLRKRFPTARILNTYGPTEATVATTWMFIDDGVIATHDPLPVGRPKPGSIVRVDGDEIIILGEHVMRGYLNSPALNHEKLFSENGIRGFRTGDLGEIGPDGLVFCRGRRDDQIKLNGYRIELQEIDKALEKLPGVTRSTVVPLRKPDGSVARLVAYVVLEPGAALVGWKEEVARHLPAYMLPSELLPALDLPVSTNGKVDRKALEKAYLTGAGAA
ncbi:MAG: AMP-binding protein [Bacillota bacterium]